MSAVLQVWLLVDHPELIPEIAAWLYDEWGHTYPDGSPRLVEKSLEERCQRLRLPLTLVGSIKNKPICTASLKIREMETHPQYEHWLGTVYTTPQFRRKGFGAQIIRAAEEKAVDLGLAQLYLYTRHLERFYGGLGWETVEHTLYKGHPAVIMRRMLG